MSNTENSSIAIIWDQSHLWGLMLIRALKHYHPPLQILTGADIANGLLSNQEHKALFVPGGWAKRKAYSLGKTGRKAIQNYLSQGGTYIGFCGGAGLALTTPKTGPSLNLCPWSRKPIQNRLPNCSGHIKLNLDLDLNTSLLSEFAQQEILAPVWWPSQFLPNPGSNVRVLGSYLQPGPDFCVADLALDSFDLNGLSAWETHYGINLHPDYLAQDPCIIQGSYGKGTYLLSYTHLETPASTQANSLLAHILKQLLPLNINIKDSSAVPDWNLTNLGTTWADSGLMQAKSYLDAIIQAGQQNKQLGWRKEWLLNWKRGIPGFALNTLYALLVQCISLHPTPESKSLWANYQQSFLKNMADFKDNYIHYLDMENKQDSKYPSSLLCNLSSDLEKLRQYLVGPFPGQGGLFAELSSVMDKILYFQLTGNF